MIIKLIKPISWTHERSITFAPHMKALFKGEMDAKVFTARIAQLVIIFLVLMAGWWAFGRWRNRMDIYDFGLISLMIILIAYYFFCSADLQVLFFFNVGFIRGVMRKNNHGSTSQIVFPFNASLIP